MTRELEQTNESLSSHPLADPGRGAAGRTAGCKQVVRGTEAGSVFTSQGFAGSPTQLVPESREPRIDFRFVGVVFQNGPKQALGFHDGEAIWSVSDKAATTSRGAAGRSAAQRSRPWAALGAPLAGTRPLQIAHCARARPDAEPPVRGCFRTAHY